ncbi:DUF1801 domain-containing protein [Sphingomonas sp. HDW15A]|uniref:DUF1801 domain-containing protein n=1 Tax=Sphingomonas sp. HDW15A TaxID=2714942 RepID=UPI0014095C10|nr:DUF1801 domain-containing protein [Sphingomonas sp. HDW15A]QIK96697.1 DUF1801 domain-containing protein [Sphingomonas sp. HDW15A]
MVSSKAQTVSEYLDELSPERRREIERVRDAINAAMPSGYREGIGYGMIGWVVPLEDYADTYNGQPLAYVGLAAQKNYNALYLTCAYASPERSQRLKDEAVAAGKKLDMGKSCIRFRKADDLPLDSIAREIASATPAEFVAIHEAARQRRDC